MRPFHPSGYRACWRCSCSDPFAPLSAGFWLSFVAMGVIILVTQWAGDSSSNVARGACTCRCAVTVALDSIHAGAVRDRLGDRPGGERAGDSCDELGAGADRSAVCCADAAVDRRVELRAGIGGVASQRRLAMACSRQAMCRGHCCTSVRPWWWYAIRCASRLAMALMPWPLLHAAVGARSARCRSPLPVGVAKQPVRSRLRCSMWAREPSVVARTAHHVLVFGTGDSYGTDGRVAGECPRAIPAKHRRQGSGHADQRRLDIGRLGRQSPPCWRRCRSRRPWSIARRSARHGTGRSVRFELSAELGRHAAEWRSSRLPDSRIDPRTGRLNSGLRRRSGYRRWAVSSRRRAPRRRKYARAGRFCRRGRAGDHDRGTRRPALPDRRARRAYPSLPPTAPTSAHCGPSRLERTARSGMMPATLRSPRESSECGKSCGPVVR